MIGTFPIEGELPMLYRSADHYHPKDEFSKLKLLCVHTSVEVASHASLIHGHPDSGSIINFFQEIEIRPEAFRVVCAS